MLLYSIHYYCTPNANALFLSQPIGEEADYTPIPVVPDPGTPREVRLARTAM